jgi:hypothetical protein
VRDLRAGKLPAAGRVDCGLQKARVTIDRFGLGLGLCLCLCRGCNDRGPLQEGRALIQQQSFAGLVCGLIAESGVLDIHGDLTSACPADEGPCAHIVRDVCAAPV